MSDNFGAISDFSFSDITNGGANRFWYNEKTDKLMVAGSDVAGRESFDDLDAFLIRAVELYDGKIKSLGTNNLNDDDPAITVQANGIAKVSGEGIGGQYRFQFDSVADAENFADLLGILDDHGFF